MPNISVVEQPVFYVHRAIGGGRHVATREQRTKGDFAYMMRLISNKYYPDAEKIIIVSDNLSTHNASSFYEAFFPETAYHLMQKFEFHYAPKHGSWLNIAESELSSLARKCLGKKRINSLDDLNEILSSWEMDRNARKKGVNWRFPAEDARIKLKRLNPTPIFVDR